jgi:sugar lactone lactonase YvrE
MPKPTTELSSKSTAGPRAAGVKHLLIPVLALLSATTASATGSSYYPTRLPDAKAVYLDSGEFSVHGDGQADDTDALQSAINKVQHDRNQGIVFVPAGRYRLSRTIYVWPGIRLIGFGTTRPTFVLARNTPAFQQGPAYMVFFAGSRPAGFQNIGDSEIKATTERPPDANPGTFYSAMSNIDIEIRDGNPGAVGIRARYAQHCYLSHMDFYLGSAMAGIHDGGNVAIDLHFHGGQYGIWTRKPSPGWQFTVMDSTFEGQAQAAIREHEAGLTLIRPRFKNVPTAISIDANYADELWIKDGRFENISGPALVISNENNPRTEINAENLVFRNAPVFAEFRESGKKLHGPGEQFVVKTFSHGLHFDDVAVPNAVPNQIRTVFEAAPLDHLPAPVPSDFPDLPAMESWVNVRDLGAHGDAKTDDTDILRKAIAEHAVLYFPSGQYLVSDTITLKSDTVLIGLHPSTTRLFLADGTPAFQGVGNPKPLVETPSGGKNIVTGIGLYTNGINPRAVGALWRSASESLMNDVRFLGGHGTIDPDASAEESRKVWSQIYNNTHTADSNLNRRWDAQYPSLWVTDGGGGTFVNIWTPSTFAQAGLYVSHTSTPGRIYQLSSEHHVHSEAVFDDVSNWQVFALQTEEERGEGGFALPLEIRDSKNLLIANMHVYRVVSSYQPAPYAILVSRSTDVRLRNIHCYSDSKVSFDDAVYDQTSGVNVRQREFAWFDISGKTPAAKLNSRVLDDGAHVNKLAGGFFNISGGAVDKAGNIYFVDAKWQTIYRWSVADQQLSKVRANPLDPVQLAFDHTGNLMVISYAGSGTVYSFDPNTKSADITLLKARPAVPLPGLTAILPVDVWRNENDFVQAVSAKKPYQFVSPDGTTFIPAGNDFVNGELYYGSKIHDVLRAFGMAPVTPGKTFYISNEEGQKTYSATIDSFGSIENLKLFQDVGGESVTTDQAGNVYIAAGQIYVYDSSGKYVETIEVPERPSQLLFGGPGGRTLFIAARSSLYAVQTRNKGN